MIIKEEAERKRRGSERKGEDMLMIWFRAMV